MSWLLNRWYKKYKRDGLIEPEEVIRYTRKIQEENDDIKKFWSECVIKGDPQKDKLKITEVFKSYKDWVKDTKKSSNTITRDKFKAEVDKIIRDITKEDTNSYINTQRIKKQNGKTLLGSKANGWWGWKWVTDEDDLLSSSDDDNNIDYDSLLSKIDNIKQQTTETQTTETSSQQSQNQQQQLFINFDAVDETDDEDDEESIENETEENEVNEAIEIIIL